MWPRQSIRPPDRFPAGWESVADIAAQGNTCVPQMKLGCAADACRNKVVDNPPRDIR
jgi:hypothetical protein